MNDYRYLDPKRVKMFLYPSDDVFVPTNWLFYSPTKYVSCSCPRIFTNYHELYINDNENDNLLKQFNQSKFS